MIILKKLGWILFTAPIFSQASVILLTGGVPAHGGCLLPGRCLVLGGGACYQGGVWSGGRLVQGECLLRGAWSRGCLLPVGGLVQGGWRSPRPPRTTTASGGTHPTGMHSCCKFKFSVKITRRHKAPERVECKML